MTKPGADGGAEPAENTEQVDAGDGEQQAPQETARAEDSGADEATQKVAKPAKGDGAGPQIDAKTEHIALGSAPPPWQRVTVSGQGTAPPPPTPASTTQQPPGLGRPPEQSRDFGDSQEFHDEPTQHTEQPMFAGLSDDSVSGRTTVTFPTAGGRPAAATAAASAATAAAPSARRTGRGPRRASLQVKRIDPWSVLKLALVLSVALFFVWMVAVGVLYGVLHGMSVWDKLNGTYKDLVQTADGANAEPLISVGRVFGVSAIVGAINIILFTAMATVSAFVYNVSAELAGGVEVTLSERD
ncbi:DUF3566 domain-containing protein [Allokutzneria albata]|uniref:DUF3566 domain-containing protein n=1 Tax=Allokutzneria albata TaxID=211114 RepID=UPI003898E3B2